MFKKIFLVLVFLSFSYADMDLKIDKIINYFVYAKNDNLFSENELKNGALVTKKINKENIVIARAKYISRDNDYVKFELFVFSDLKQGALPIPKLIPTVGDGLVLNKFIKNTFLIAPSKAVYDKIIKNYSDFNFFNTDALAAKIYEDSKNLPTRNDIRNYCSEWVLGSVMVVLEDGLRIFECSSLEEITKLDDEKYEVNEKVNFYSNLSKVLGKGYDYSSYYKELFLESGIKIAY